jgi:hypothetical protein
MESMSDLMGQLSVSTEKRAPGFVDRVERSLPKVEDYLLPQWIPPMDQNVIRQRIEATTFISTPFRTNTKHNGQDLSKPTYLRGKVLDTWQADRCVRPYKAYQKFVKGPDGSPFKPYRFRQQPELLKTWDMDLYPDKASLYWLDQPNTHVYDTGQQYQAENARHMPKREQHLYPIYYKQKRLEEEEKRFKKMQQGQLISRNLMTIDKDEDGDHLARSSSQVKFEDPPAPDGDAAGSTTEESKAVDSKKPQQRSKSEERFFKDSKVRHLDPFKYVNRNYRQLGLSLPYQLPAETLQMEREYLPNAKKSMGRHKSKSEDILRVSL